MTGFSQQQIDVLTRSSNDFVTFVNEIFSLSSKTFIGGQYIDDTARFLSQNDRTIRVSARNHFKSYAFYAYYMWKLMFDGATTNIEAHYFSYNADLAAYHVRKIKAAIENNPFFENIIDTKPTAETVLRYTWDREHYTSLHPHGLIQFKRGIHCLGPNEDIIVCDPLTGDIRKCAIQNIFRHSDDSLQKFTEILTENGFKKIVQYLKRKNTDKLYKIKLLNGAMMKITPDHPCVIKRNNKICTIPADTLKHSDLIPYKPQCVENVNKKLGSYELGRFIGIYCGDGSRQGTKGLQFVNNLKKGTSVFLEKFAKESLGSNTRIIKYDNYERMFIPGKAAIELTYRFVRGHSSRTKHLTSDIFNMSTEFKLGFVDGYIEADGTHNAVATASQSLANDFCALVSSLGFHYNLMTHHIIGGYDERYKDVKRTMYIIRLNPGTNKTRRPSFNRIVVDKDDNGIMWLPIVKISKSNRIPDYVYDIQVDSNTHLFSLANGIITHNCDYVFVDDPFQDPDNELNPSSIYKINEVFKSNILDMPHADGILHVAGTPQTNSDFFFDDSVTRRFKVRILPAITTEGKALWPEWMNIDELEEKRIERTDRIFKREYLCLPTYSAKGFFNKEQIEAKIVNKNLSPLSVLVPYKTERRVIAGFDIGKKAHPSYLAVFEERPGKLIMIHEKWMDNWNYSNGEEYDASKPTQLEYLKLAITNLKIQELHYDNTRGEFEAYAEQGLLPLQMVPIVFSTKSRNTMATVLDRIVERGQMEIMNNDRTVGQICVVTNDLQAIASKFGHGDCYDDQTEVLTKNGWKFFKELTYDDTIATLQDQKYLMYQKPSSIINEKYIGKMYMIDSTQVNLVVTPRHKLFVDPYKYRTEHKYLLEFPHAVKGKKVMYKKDAVWKGRRQKFFILDNIKINIDVFLKFIGYYVSEGYTAHNKSIIICQKRTWKSDRMYKDLVKLPFNIKRNDYKKLGDVYFCSVKMVKWCRENLGTKSINKHLPQWILELPSTQLHILLDALILGDGTDKEWSSIKGCRYDTISKKLADQIQEIALKIGWSANIYSSDDNIGRKGIFGVGQHRTYRVSFIQHKNQPTVNKRTVTDKWIKYNGTIHCCTVPNHVIYVRRRGKPVWSGNSFWGCGLAVLGSNDILTYADASVGALRREINVGSGSIFSRGSKIPKGW